MEAQMKTYRTLKAAQNEADYRNDTTALTTWYAVPHATEAYFILVTVPR